MKRKLRNRRNPIMRKAMNSLERVSDFTKCLFSQMISVGSDAFLNFMTLPSNFLSLSTSSASTANIFPKSFSKVMKAAVGLVKSSND